MVGLALKTLASGCRQTSYIPRDMLRVLSFPKLVGSRRCPIHIHKSKIADTRLKSKGGRREFQDVESRRRWRSWILSKPTLPVICTPAEGAIVKDELSLYIMVVPISTGILFLTYRATKVVLGSCKCWVPGGTSGFQI